MSALPIITASLIGLATVVIITVALMAYHRAAQFWDELEDEQ